MTYKDAMKYLHVGSYNTLYKLLNDGLKVTHIGDKKFISVKSANEYIEQHTAPLDHKHNVYGEDINKEYTNKED
jgi:hypothetical protein